jgi:hypothetical protein
MPQNQAQIDVKHRVIGRAVEVEQERLVVLVEHQAVAGTVVHAGADD